MFNIGDIVVHPKQGVCTIEKIANRDGNIPVYTLTPRGYVKGRHFKIFISAKSIRASGVRYPVDKRKIPHVLRKLEDRPHDLFGDRDSGYPETCESVKSSDLGKVAAAIRDLAHDKSAKYSSIKDRLLKFARRKLAGEVAYVEGISAREANEKIEKALSAQKEGSR